jgi:superfamily I DNA/RNA helicase
MAMLSLSPEQQSVVELATTRPRPGGEMTRITAGAGTGKTTTLKALAERFTQLGLKATYVTFSKKGADDAKRRLGDRADCRTLDSVAFELVVKGTNCGDPGDPLADRKLEAKILRLCGDSIASLLEPAVEVLHREARAQNNRQKKLRSEERRWQRTVGFYIRKTLERFLHSKDSAEEGFDHMRFGKTYYPAKKWHNEAGRGGGPAGLCKDPKDFYCKNAKLVWNALRPWNSQNEASNARLVWTYGSAFKEMQLRRAHLPSGVPILCDESQDMNECQVDWVVQQRQGRCVFFVGDQVQVRSC